MRQTSIAPALRLNAFNANDDDDDEDIATLSSSALRRRRGTTTTTNGKKITRRNKTNRIHFDDESMEMDMKEKLEKQRKYREELEMQLRSERDYSGYFEFEHVRSGEYQRFSEESEEDESEDKRYMRGRGDEGV